jgi:hypothetical protein
MSVTIREIKNHSELRRYIFLPAKVYQHEARWVPPFYTDEWDFHNPEKNRALAYCEVIRLLAYSDNQPVGRIMGIIHHPYNELHLEKTARFFHFDCIKEQEVAHSLIQAISTWAFEKGMTKLIGPFGFSDKDPQGLQIEGFDFLPVLATPANPAYLPELLVKEGFVKEVDCVSYQMEIPESIPPAYLRVFERMSKNESLNLIEFTSKQKLKPYIIPVLRLMNEAYAHIFGFIPLSEPEMKKFASQYLPVLDPEFIKLIVDKNQEVIAFVIAIPEMSRGVQQAKGKLFPLGFFYIMNAMRKTRQLNLMLGAIKPSFQRRGISVLMGKSLLESARKRGMVVMDSHLILENNMPMRSECEKLDGKVYKRFRIFSKNISRPNP